MCKAIDVASWFINNNYNPENSKESNLKLNKLLYFAQLISLIKREKPLFSEDLYAFENGVVVEAVRKPFCNDYLNFVETAKGSRINFSNEELEILNLTKDIFLGVSPEDLSNLTHEHKSWKEHFKKSKERACNNYKYNKEESKICIDDYFSKFKDDLDLVQEIVMAKENNNLRDEKVFVINGTSYYYDPKELVLNDEIIEEIKQFPAIEEAYTLYMDESQGLIIF
ncbi:Panacea domain-containing protein [Clostridium perfringens]